MRRGFLGGTFDPVHVGHLDVAAAAQQALRLDEVSFVPSNVPPHRTSFASAGDRFAMVELAVRNRPGFVASRLDLDASGPSYTTGTLDRIEALGLMAGDVFFIIGADAFRDIQSWKDYPRILDRCHFVAVSRAGNRADGLRAALPALAARMRNAAAGVPSTPAIFLVDAPTAPVSSTEVRRRLTRGDAIEGLVPGAVATYIQQHGLYRSLPTSERT
jgi:nicotinate-nucleotide adenylyltransferase